MQYPGYEQVPQQHYSMYPQDPYQQQIIQQQVSSSILSTVLTHFII
jgi:hypothetical protein